MFYFSYIFLEQREFFSYYRKHKPSTILAAYYNDRHIDFFNSGEFQKAYDFLLKACKAEPCSIELWGKLAFLCEMVLHDNILTDKYLQEAKGIIDSGEKLADKELAWYEYFLGQILCNRGRNYDGLEHLRRSIELDEDSHRLAKYEEKLSEITGGIKEE